MKRVITATKDTEYDINQRADFIRDIIDDVLKIDFADVPEERLTKIHESVSKMYKAASEIESELADIREGK